jgi:type I restriction enzyme S subunit
VGKVGLWEGRLDLAAFDVNIMRLVPNPEVIPDGRFLNMVMNWRPVVRALRQLATGTTSVAAIYWKDLRNLRVPLPPIEVQILIARMIYQCENAIALRRRTFHTKRRFKRGLMQQLLSGARRFPGFTRPWHEHHLGDLFAERVEIGRSDLPLLSITADRGVVPRDHLDRRDTSNADKSQYLRIAPGDIGYNTMRMWQGVSALSLWRASLAQRTRSAFLPRALMARSLLPTSSSHRW